MEVEKGPVNSRDKNVSSYTPTNNDKIRMFLLIHLLIMIQHDSLGKLSSPSQEPINQISSNYCEGHVYIEAGING